jgi:DNA sulfur modification protein DndE
MKKILALAAAAFLLMAFSVSRPTIYMIGDSTMADKQDKVYPERGWGMFLQELCKKGVDVQNYAMNGRSTRTFISEGRWQAVLDKLKPGDFVVIQFGHNDQSKEKVDRYTAPDDFKANMRRFVLEARSKGATPILCTPVVRRRFDDKGVFYDVHGEYPGLTRSVANEAATPLVDMQKLSEEVVSSYGADSSKRLFIHLKPGELACAPEGKTDDTHFTEEGARIMAKLFASNAKLQKLAIAKFLR